MAHDPDRPREEIYPGPPYRVREGDNLYYIPPSGERFFSVTSALEHRAKEDLDHRWRPGLSAKAAFTHLPKLIAASILPDCGRTYGACSKNNTRPHDWQERCPQCPCEVCTTCVVKFLTYEHYRESSRATTRGSAFHHWFETWVLLDGDEPAVWADFRATCGRRTVADVEDWVEAIRPYTASALRFVEDYGLSPGSWEMAEATVLNRTHMWGGTLDGRVRFDAAASSKAMVLCERLGKANPLVSVDTKTREKPDAQYYDEHALQLAPYRRGEVILLRDGTEVPLGPDDGGLLVQVRPDGYGARLMVTDEATYVAFLHTLEMARWTVQLGGESHLERAHPRQPLEGISPPPRPPRAPRKTAVGTAASAARAGVAKLTGAKRLPTSAVKAKATGRPVEEVMLPTTLDGDVGGARPAESATMASLRRVAAGQVHPDSPYGDGIPF